MPTEDVEFGVPVNLRQLSAYLTEQGFELAEQSEPDVPSGPENPFLVLIDDPEVFVSETMRLAAVLGAIGVQLEASVSFGDDEDDGRPFLSGRFDPVSGSGMVEVFNLTDDAFLWKANGPQAVGLAAGAPVGPGGQPAAEA